MITRIATPAILLTTLPMITGVGVAAGGLNTLLPPKIDVLDGDTLDAAPVPPPAISPPVPADAGSDVGLERRYNVDASGTSLDKLEDMREVREDREALAKVVELEKLRDKLLEPEIRGAVELEPTIRDGNAVEGVDV